VRASFVSHLIFTRRAFDGSFGYQTLVPPLAMTDSELIASAKALSRLLGWAYFLSW